MTGQNWGDVLATDIATRKQAWRTTRRTGFHALLTMTALVCAAFSGGVAAQSVVCAQNMSQCTANDLTSVDIVLGAGAPVSCIAGTKVSIPVQLNATNSGNNTRYDLGVAYNGVSGTGPYTYNTTAAACQARPAPNNSGNFGNLDGDQWGDLAGNSVASAVLNGGNVDVICQPNTNGVLAVPGLVYWSINSTNNATLPLPNTPKCAARTLLPGIAVKGALTITKVAAGSVEDNFGFNVSSTGGTATPGSFSLLNGQSQVVATDLSTNGISYTVAESAAPGWGLASVSCQDGTGANVPVTISNGQSSSSISVTMSYAVPQISCTFNNVQPGTVTLSKQWSNAIAGDSVSLQITGGASSPATGSSTAPGTTVDATTNASAGATIALAETFTNGSAANYSATLACSNGGVPVALAGSSFVMPQGGSVACTYTNTRATAALTINKQISGGPGALSGTFNFAANCGVDGTFVGDVVLTGQNSGSVVVGGIPAGASCTVTESGVPVAPAGYTWGMTPADQQVAITAAGGGSVTFVNTLNADPGSIAVSKNITGVAANLITSNLSFPFSVNCSTPTGSYAGTVTVNAGTLTGNTTVPNVPAGSSACAIVEGALPAAPAGYAWGTATYTQPVGTLAAAGTLTGAISNPLTANPGSVVVTKNIAGVAASAISANLAFPITISCSTPVANYSGTVTVTTGTLTGSTTLTGIAAGSTACVVAEGSLPAAPTGYVWGAASYVQPVGTVPAGGSLSATVNNTLTAAAISPPALTKAAQLTNAGTNEITWTIVVQNNAAGNALLGPQALTLIDPVPAGASYVVGSLACSSNAGASVSGCAFDVTPNATRFTVLATLPFNSSVTITVKTASAAGVTNVFNSVSASFDADPVLAQASASAAQSLIQAAVRVPTLDLQWLLAIMAAVLLIAGGTLLAPRPGRAVRRD